MLNSNIIFEYLGKFILYGGGSVAIAYVLFMFMGKKWIENKFKENLQELKHGHSKELEDLKFKINTHLDRASRIHEKEFEVLPEAWNKLHDTLLGLKSLTAVFQQYPDFDNMTESQLSDYLLDSQLHEHEKDQLKIVPDKLKYYRKVIFWHNYSEVRSLFYEFHKYIQRNRIFLRDDLKEQFSIIDKLMWHTLIDREASHETDDFKLWNKTYKTIYEETDSIVNQIEALVQDRLQYNL